MGNCHVPTFPFEESETPTRKLFPGEPLPSPDGPPSDACALCGYAPAMQSCGGCAVTLYCGAECQRAHWVSGHSNECVSLRMAKASVPPTPPRPEIPKMRNLSPLEPQKTILAERLSESPPVGDQFSTDNVAAAATAAAAVVVPALNEGASHTAKGSAVKKRGMSSFGATKSPSTAPGGATSRAARGATRINAAIGGIGGGGRGEGETRGGTGGEGAMHDLLDQVDSSPYTSIVIGETGKQEREFTIVRLNGGEASDHGRKQKASAVPRDGASDGGEALAAEDDTEEAAGEGDGKSIQW